MNKEKAIEKIAQNLRVAEEMLNACVKLAEEHQIGFQLPWGGEGEATRGMGAYYSPEGDPDAEYSRNEYRDQAGWHSSAGTC